MGGRKKEGSTGRMKERKDAHTQTQTVSTTQKAIIHQVTTMLATSKHLLLPGHNHLLKPHVAY